MDTDSPRGEIGKEHRDVVQYLIDTLGWSSLLTPRIANTTEEDAGPWV